MRKERERFVILASLDLHKEWSVPLVLGLGLVGCGMREGNENLSKMNLNTVKQKIVVGKTTKEGIRRLLGNPQGQGIDPHMGEYWMYSFTQTKLTASSYIPVVGLFTGGTKIKMTTIYIYFNKNGVVKKYSFMKQHQNFTN